MQLLRDSYSRALSSDDSGSRYPVAFLHLVLPPSAIDVNVEPNKTRIMLHNQVWLCHSTCYGLYAPVCCTSFLRKAWRTSVIYENDNYFEFMWISEIS
jgi:DNA mismatch repair protein, C-terminal domain